MAFFRLLLSIFPFIIFLSCQAFQPLLSQPSSQSIIRCYASSSSIDDNNPTSKKHVVVVGGGWAGFSAADALVATTTGSTSSTSDDDDDLQVTLLDAAPRGKGGLAGGWRTEQGRPVEAGIHGFWREYRNTFAVLDRLKLDKDVILTPYTPSALYSCNGKVAVAPVMKNDKTEATKDGTELPLPWNILQSASNNCNNSNGNKPNYNAILKPLAALLPVPLDLALLADFNPLSPLKATDRVSAVGLLGAWADFGQEDPTSWAIYDAISAEDLFLRKAGVTPTLYEELVLPLLHVLPMCPGYDCSAAAALSCFHVFALQAQGAFDVRWCRGAIAEKIFNPWAEQLAYGGVDIQGNSKVSSIEKLEDGKFELSFLGDDTKAITCDAVVMAVGGTAIGRLAPASPAFDSVPISKQFDKLRGVTCVAVRLFLKPHTITSNLKGGKYDSTQAPPDIAKAMYDSPVAVCGARIGGSSIPELEETGFCIYDLQRLHDEFAVDNNNDNLTAVLEVDFFRADDIANLEDDEKVAELALRAVSATFQTAGPIPTSDIVDLAVVRARNAVSHFAVKSASYSPPVKLYKGLYMAGDWIDRTGHASWSTEKAVVTGRQAAKALLEDMGNSRSAVIDIIPAVSDSPPLDALRRGAKVLRSVAPPPGDGVPPSPWSFLKSVIAERQ